MVLGRSIGYVILWVVEVRINWIEDKVGFGWNYWITDLLSGFGWNHSISNIVGGVTGTIGLML